MKLEEKLRTIIRDVPDFPKEGIIFKDISTIMLNAELSNEVLEELVDKYAGKGIDAIAGIESRGFLFGFPLAMRLGVPFILIRKKGKLPYNKMSYDYELEYGQATIEMHTDAIPEGKQVLIHDDLLATGGSAMAAARLIEKCGGKVHGFNFLVSLDFLNGEEKLRHISSNIVNLARF
jgi:adenine phosphoribosyltransferase